MTAPQGAQGVTPSVPSPLIPRSSRGHAPLPQATARTPLSSFRPSTPARRTEFVQLPVLVLLLAGVGISALWLGVGVEMRSFEQQRESGSTEELPAAQIAQSFRSPRANLSRVELLLRSYAGLPGDGTVRLLEGDGTGGNAIFETTLDKGRFDNPYLSFEFSPLSASEGATYTLMLETPGRPLNSAVGIAYTNYDTLTSGQMYTDGEAADAELVFSTYYRYGIGSLLGDIEQTVAQRGRLVAAWLFLLLLPGLALLVWLPNSFCVQQRLLAAPGISLLVLPVFYLLMRA